MELCQYYQQKQLPFLNCCTESSSMSDKNYLSFISFDLAGHLVPPASNFGTGKQVEKFLMPLILIPVVHTCISMTDYFLKLLYKSVYFCLSLSLPLSYTCSKVIKIALAHVAYKMNSNRIVIGVIGLK